MTRKRQLPPASNWQPKVWPVFRVETTERQAHTNSRCKYFLFRLPPHLVNACAEQTADAATATWISLPFVHTIISDASAQPGQHCHGQREVDQVASAADGATCKGPRITNARNESTLERRYNLIGWSLSRISIFVYCPFFVDFEWG